MNRYGGGSAIPESEYGVELRLAGAGLSRPYFAAFYCVWESAEKHRNTMRLLLFVLLIAVPVAAQDDLKREIAAIAAMRNDLQRLAAFDAFAAKLGLAPGSQATTSVAGKWSVSREVSPVDDSVTVTAHLQADSPAPSRRGRDGPAMILRYKEGKVDAYVVFDTFLGSESTTATVRFGKDPAVEQRWWISTDHKAAFVMGDALEFMRKLEQSDTFLIRVTPYSESPVTVSFSTAGVSKVVEAIVAAQAARKK